MVLVLPLLAACAGGEDLRLSDPSAEVQGLSIPVEWSRDLGRAAEFTPVSTPTGWLVGVTNSILVHVRARDGVELWKRKLGGPPVGAPVVLGDQVLIASDVAGLELMGISLATGKVNWRRPAVGARVATGGSALVVTDRRGRVRRTDPVAGDSLWSALVPGAGARDPRVLSEADLVLIPTRGDSVVALDLQSGRRRWAVAGGSRPRIAATGEHLVCFSADGVLRVYALRGGDPVATLSLGGFPAGDPVLVEGGILAATTRGEVHRLDLPGLVPRWKRRLDPPLRAAPGITASLVLQPGPRGRVHLLDLETGVERGVLRVPELLLVSPASAGDRVLIMGERGTATAFRVGEAR